MTRMSRELSLVLVSSGMLASGYLLCPEPDFEKRAEEQAAQRVGGRPNSRSHIIFIGHYGVSGSVSGVGRSPALAAVSRSRGGIGSIGMRVSGGS